MELDESVQVAFWELSGDRIAKQHKYILVMVVLWQHLIVFTKTRFIISGKIPVL
jgi:hypothetical protein